MLKAETRATLAELLFLTTTLLESKNIDEASAHSRLTKLLLLGDISEKTFDTISGILGTKKTDKDDPLVPSPDCFRLFVPYDGKKRSDVDDGRIEVRASDGCHTHSIATIIAKSVESVDGGFILNFKKGELDSETPAEKTPPARKPVSRALDPCARGSSSNGRC